MFNRFKHNQLKPEEGSLWVHIFAILSYMKSLSLTQPHLIAVIGIPGSGKTHFAKQFSETFHAPYLSLEAIVAACPDKDAAEKILHLHLAQLFKTSSPILIEGLGSTRAERVALGKQARAAGYKMLFVWVQTEQATAQSRSQKPPKGSDKRAMSAEDFTKESRRFSAPAAIERPVVISGKHTYATQAKVILKHLSSPRAEAARPVAPPTRPTTPRRSNIIVR